jgi:hypothetical protein
MMPCRGEVPVEVSIYPNPEMGLPWALRFCVALALVEDGSAIKVRLKMFWKSARILS